MGIITGLTIKKIKKTLSCLISNILCFCLANLITFPSGRSIAKNWGYCKAFKDEGVVDYADLEKWGWLRIVNKFHGLFALLPLLNLEVLWTVLSILSVCIAFIPSSTQSAWSWVWFCILCHLCLCAPCQLPCHHRSLSSSPHGSPVLRPYLAVAPVNSQILLVWMELCCPRPEPALSYSTFYGR